MKRDVMALQYELFYLIGETKEPNLASIKEEVAKMVAAVGGTMLDGEMEERRKIAYPIDKETRGVYVTKRFSLPDADERTENDSADAVAVLTRQLHLYRDMLRFIIVRAEGLPELGERETVPQIPGRSDSRRRDTRSNDRPVIARPAQTQEEVKPVAEVKEAAPKEEAKEETKEAAQVEEVKTEEVKPAEEKKPARKRAPKAAPKKESAAEEEAEEKKEEKPVSKEKVQEEEIDKKLDEILNI